MIRLQSTEKTWGIGLMLTSVALAVFVGKILGAVCGIAGIAIIVWAHYRGHLPEERPTFVLEVEGTHLLDDHPDWRFFLTNICGRNFTSIQLGTLRSEIGAYEIRFKTIPLLMPNHRLAVGHDIISRRESATKESATLWDFAQDHAGERGHRFIWYDIPVTYRERGTTHDAGIVSICFDLQNKIMKTDGVELWEEQKYFKAERL